MSTPPSPADIMKIMELLPHRYPFLLVDKVLEVVPGESITALKNVTFNEPFFQGHFPGLPVMPGVLTLEAMAQAGAVMGALGGSELGDDKIFMFTGMNKVKFRKPVRPGDQLILECFDVKRRLAMLKMQCRATVDGELCAEAQLNAAIVDKDALS